MINTVRSLMGSVLGGLTKRSSRTTTPSFPTRSLSHSTPFAGLDTRTWLQVDPASSSCPSLSQSQTQWGTSSGNPFGSLSPPMPSPSTTCPPGPPPSSQNSSQNTATAQSLAQQMNFSQGMMNQAVNQWSQSLQQEVMKSNHLAAFTNYFEGGRLRIRTRNSLESRGRGGGSDDQAPTGDTFTLEMLDRAVSAAQATGMNQLIMGMPNVRT